MREHDLNPTPGPLDEQLPEGLRPAPACPPLRLLLAHREGVLPEDAAKEVEAHLVCCSLCRGLLADLEHLDPPGLTQRERESMRSRLPIPASSTGKGWRWYVVSGAVAATLLVCAALTLHVWRAADSVPQTAQTHVPAPQQAPPPDRPSSPAPTSARVDVEVAKLDPPLSAAPGLVLRGAGPIGQPDASQLAPAFDAYGRNDYTLAADRFNLLAKQFPRAEVPVLYLGVTQLLMHNDQAAFVSLTRAEKLATTSQRHIAEWYRAVAAARTGNPEASDLLDTVCRDKDSSYAKQACALKEKI